MLSGIAKRLLSLAAVLGLLVGSTRPALAQDARCASLYESVQTLRQRSKLLQARDAALACASGACPKTLASDCSGWLSELEPAIPRVVFEARDEQGSVLTDVSVSVDKQVVAERIDGRTIEIDPGEHSFRFRRSSGAFVEVTTVVIEGEKSRRVSATFPTGAPPATGGIGTLPLIWGGVSIAGFGLGTTFGVLALQQKRELDREDCRPYCAPERGVSLSRQAAVSDIGFAVGLLAAVAAVSIYFIEKPKRKASRATKFAEPTPKKAITQSPSRWTPRDLQACSEQRRQALR